MKRKAQPLTRLGRARLIHDLKVDFGVNDEGIAIVLHLLDQLHGLRCLLRDIHAMDVSDPDKERTFTRLRCAELLLDAGATVVPVIWGER